MKTNNNDVNVNMNVNKNSNNNKNMNLKEYFNQNIKSKSTIDQDSSNKIKNESNSKIEKNDKNDIVFAEKDNKLQQFIKENKNHKKVEENESNLDLASSYKMLIQLSQIAQQTDDNKDKGISLNDIDVIDKELESLTKNVSDVNINKDGDEGIKDDIINTKEVIIDSNNETYVGYENPEIAIKSDEEVQIMVQELISCIGERLYKFSYKIVWDNVSINNNKDS